MEARYLICGASLAGFAGLFGGSLQGDRSATAAPAGQPASGNPFAKSAESVVEGREIYLKYGCAGCHGVGGGGGMGKPISDDTWQFGSDDQTLFKLLRGEIPEQTMPGSIGRSMTDDEVWKVLAYVRSLYRGAPGKVNWVVPPPVTPEMLAAANPRSADPITAGKQVFAQTCSACHGPQGKGDGVASAALDPKPHDLTDAAYMAKLSERYLFELISRGGLAVGKSALMPAQPRLAPKDIKNVIAFVKSLSASRAK